MTNPYSDMGRYYDTNTGPLDIELSKPGTGALKRPPRRPHRIVPAGPPVPAAAHLAAGQEREVYWRYSRITKARIIVASVLAVSGIVMAVLGWMILQMPVWVVR